MELIKKVLQWGILILFFISLNSNLVLSQEAQEGRVRRVEVTGEILVVNISNDPLIPLEIVVIKPEGTDEVYMLIGKPMKELLDLEGKKVTLMGTLLPKTSTRYRGEYLDAIEVKEYFIHPEEKAQEKE